MASNTIARRLLRLYPRAWRERYEDEVLALVEETGLTASHSLDLLLGAGREWVRLPASRVGQFVTEGVSLNRIQRMSVGYERFMWAALGARLFVALLVYYVTRRLGPFLVRGIAEDSWLDWVLLLTPCVLFAGCFRLMKVPRREITPAEQLAWEADLDRYPLPRLNRWFSWAFRRTSRPVTSAPLPVISVAEALCWSILAVFSVSYFSARLEAESTAWFPLRWHSLYWSFWASLVVTSSIAGVVRRGLSRQARA